MTVTRTLYWLVTGALIGFGVIGMASIGLPFLLLGLLLVMFGAVRLGGTGLWAAAVGFGGVPALILLWDVTPRRGPASRTAVERLLCPTPTTTSDLINGW